MGIPFQKLDDDCVGAILGQLPLEEKFRFRRVCRKWRSKLDQHIKAQSTLALFDKPYPLSCSSTGSAQEDGCGQHQLCDLDILLAHRFDNDPDQLASVIRQLPALQHVCIRLLDTEQLDRLCEKLVNVLNSLSCLELPFSSALPLFVPRYASSLKHIECSYFNCAEPLQELFTKCQQLQYVYMIGCPEFPSHLLNAASRNLKHVYTMERITYAPPASTDTPGKPPNSIRGLGFISAQNLAQVVKEHPKLTHLLLEFYQGYCSIADLSKLKDLKQLYLREYNRKKAIDDHLIQALQDCGQLRSLNLQNVNVTDALFEKLLTICPLIEHIYVNNVQMGHFAEDQISGRLVSIMKKQAKHLKSLQVQGPNSIGPQFNAEPVKGTHCTFNVYAALR